MAVIILDKKNRVVRPEDFRQVFRRGQRVSGRYSTIHILFRAPVGFCTTSTLIQHDSYMGSRFGFVVTKSVGNAVVRNVVRRRLRAIGREALLDFGEGYDVVIRALPGSGRVGWDILHAEVGSTLKQWATRG